MFYKEKYWFLDSYKETRWKKTTTDWKTKRISASKHGEWEQKRLVYAQMVSLNIFKTTTSGFVRGWEGSYFDYIKS